MKAGRKRFRIDDDDDKEGGLTEDEAFAEATGRVCKLLPKARRSPWYRGKHSAAVTRASNASPISMAC